jgi:hypothetical protein
MILKSEDTLTVLKSIAPFEPGARGEGLKEAALEVLNRHGAHTSIEEVMSWCLRAVQPLMGEIPGAATETIPFYGALFQWAQIGCPHFSLTSDFFNAVVLTDFGDPTDEPLYLPFDVFTLSFPKSDAFGESSRLMVYKVPTIRFTADFRITELRWKLYRATLLKDAPIFTQWLIGMTRRELAQESEQIDKTIPGSGVRPLDEDEKHLPLRIRTMLANVMSYIESYGPLPTVPRAKKGAAPAPVELVHSNRPLYEVGRTVKLDGKLRTALTESQGNQMKWRVSQRFVVRGHWRNQAYGEGRQFRRRTWIEPHYKGPENVAEAINRMYEVSL